MIPNQHPAWEIHRAWEPIVVLGEVGEVDANGVGYCDCCLKYVQVSETGHGAFQSYLIDFSQQ